MVCPSVRRRSWHTAGRANGWRKSSVFWRGQRVNYNNGQGQRFQTGSVSYGLLTENRNDQIQRTSRTRQATHTKREMYGESERKTTATDERSTVGTAAHPDGNIMIIIYIYRIILQKYILILSILSRTRRRRFCTW